MTDTTLPRCDRTGRIVEAVLDGNEAGLDRAHLAVCATCLRETQRARQFLHGVSATAAEAGEGIPDLSLLDSRRRLRGGRTGRLTLRVVALAGALAAGLVIATLIGSRALAPTGRGPSIFGSSAAAQERLSGLRLSCEPIGTVVDCSSVAVGHVHRVLLTIEDGQVVAVEARIESTDGKSLVLDGADVMFSRFAGAVLAPEARGDAMNWITANFMRCGSGCTADLGNVHLDGSLGQHAVVLEISQR
jgi:hypothetical protein